MHSLVNCETTKLWMKNTFDLLTYRNCKKPNFNEQEFIFGVQDQALNIIFLIIKYYIILQRGINESFLPHLIIQEIRNRISIDKKNLREPSFKEKWANYLQLGDSNLK